MTLLLASFLAGILTILAPCVLPVLPVVLAGSLGEKQKWYPYLVILSLALSIVLFTVVLKVSTIFIDIPQNFWKHLSGGILIALGLIYVFPHVWTWIVTRLNLSRSSASLDKAQDISSPVTRAIATGAALGPVFSTCSPTYTLLLATVFPVSLVAGISYTLVYALGLSLMLIIIALLGRSIIARLRIVADERSWFKRILGIIFVLIGLMIVSGLDKKFETYVLQRFDVSSIETHVLDTLMSRKKPSTEPVLPITPEASAPVTISDTRSSLMTQESGEMKKLKNTLPEQFLAPEISLTEWINSSPLTMESLRGKVVLIDFWTFGCINCQRTRPYLNEWHRKYNTDGLVIIGVHAPEFSYEKVRSNIEAAIKKEGIQYPVVLDNDFDLWRSYKNQYWPAFYFVDKNGYVRHSHFGEGKYEENEEIIKTLLTE